MSLQPIHVWKRWFVFPDLLFHNMRLTNPGIVILESVRAIRKETNITGKTWRMFRSCADLIIWASNAAETRPAQIITLPPCEAFAMMYASLHPPLFLPQCTNHSGTGTSSDNMTLFIYFLQCSRVQSLSPWSGIKSSSRPQDITRFFKKEKLLTASIRVQPVAIWNFTICPMEGS